MRSGFADVGVEHLRVERAKPRNIIRYQRNMVQPVQQHRFLLSTPTMRRYNGDDARRRDPVIL